MTANTPDPACLARASSTASSNTPDPRVIPDVEPDGASHALITIYDYPPAMQDLLAHGSACFETLKDLSLHMDDDDDSRRATPYLDLTCVSRLTNLRTLALQGLPNMLASPALPRLPHTLTALLLHGTDCERAAAADFGRPLLRLTRLQCLDVDVTICQSGGRGGIVLGAPSAAQQAFSFRRRFWEGLRPVLQDLPLHLGARVTCII